MSKMRIGASHPIRSRVLALEDYYGSKGEFISALHAAFDACDLEVNCHDMGGDDGHALWAIRPKNSANVCCEECLTRVEKSEFENRLACSWYRVSDAKIEFITYVR